MLEVLALMKDGQKKQVVWVCVVVNMSKVRIILKSVMQHGNAVVGLNKIG